MPTCLESAERLRQDLKDAIPIHMQSSPSDHDNIPNISIYCGDDANVRVAMESTVVLLCVKPQLAHHVLDAVDVQQALHGKLLISILAGFRLAQLKELVPHTAVVRAMPNTYDSSIMTYLLF